MRHSYDDEAPAQDWRFFQVFGEEQDNRTSVEEIQDADLLSAIDFDDSGDYLATGDRGGRVVVFERANNGENSPPGTKLHAPQHGRTAGNAHYRFLTEFQSHEPEFDYLKSLEIEEKINSLRWCKGTMGCKMLLTSNDKTVKLWKVYGKKIKAVSNMNLRTVGERGPIGRGGASACAAAGDQLGRPPRIDSLRLPQMSTCERVVTATTKRTYANAHTYHINSLAVNADGETFISCDDLRLNLWNLNYSNACFTLVDLKPKSMESLSEVVTSSDFHPHHCHSFLFSSSRGCVRVGDMREAALCERQAKVFDAPEDPAARQSFFHEITSSISNARYSRCGRYIIARDYMSIRVWDTHMESRPISTHLVHEHLRPKLGDLYESDCIFDKFEVSVSHDSSYLLTGSYQNQFHLISRDGTQPPICLEAAKGSNGRRGGTPVARSGSSGSSHGESADFTKRTLNLACHPHEDIVAVAATSTLYVFRA
mmetsp:Transcript_25512/g.43595  ORF Transcript_25512/g.43595 Transcript_25512/m.43595 type:complete len:481 (+) Transcript_25512:61-1503(+)